MCLCSRTACTPPILAGVCGVGVFAWARSACARPFLAGVLRSCVCVSAPPVPRLSGLGFVVRVSRFGFWLSPRQSWPWCWGVCVCVPALHVPRQSWLWCAVWLCVLGFESAAPRHSWLGCWVCVLVCALCLYLANGGWSSWCVCLASGFGFHPGNPGWGVCVRAPPVPCRSLLGCAV